MLTCMDKQPENYSLLDMIELQEELITNPYTLDSDLRTWNSLVYKRRANVRFLERNLEKTINEPIQSPVDRDN